MDDIERLKEAIGSAKRIVAFTGAGISTESGIPDCRSPGGIWT
jgi:NAD-dependent deacetylase